MPDGFIAGISPAVDIVVAVHDPRRPVERAVRSALTGGAPVRVTIVIHNTDHAPVRARLGTLADDSCLRFLELHDGIRSPAGPFNAGLDAATAPFTSVLGSDDELAPGAVTSWLRLASRTRADAVIARLRYADGRGVPTPPTRPGRRAGLDPVVDRLSYRSAPLGLVSRERFGEMRFAAGLASGEDIPFAVALWFSGARIAYDRRGPAYLVHSDATDRTTVVHRDVASTFGYLPDLERLAEQLDDAARLTLTVKLVRIQVFGFVQLRSDASAWTAADRRDLARVIDRVLALSPGAERVLSRADRAVLDALRDPASDTAMLLQLAGQRRRFASPAGLLPREARLVFHREAPLRFATASAAALLGL